MGTPSAYVIPWWEIGLVRQRRQLRLLLAAPVRILAPTEEARKEEAYLGWGHQPSGRRALQLAQGKRRKCLLLEDGFLRSFGLGHSGSPPLSVVVDDVGVHYDATRPSRLERTLREGTFSKTDLREAERAIRLLRQEGLSKYNIGLPIPPGTFPENEVRALVVDQVAGDMSIAGGLATVDTFHKMLEVALEENPQATIYVKAHPDTLTGLRRGCIPQLKHERVRWLNAAWHPHDVLAHFDKVYVVSSLMGLDALILGKEVHCFGMPFYAGWGLTHDRQQCNRRGRQRSLEELVHAAYFQHARYLDPIESKPTDFFTVARHICLQKRQYRYWASLDGQKPWTGRVYAFGFRYWKHAMTRPFFGEGVQVRFMRTVGQARRKGINAHDRIAVWGMRDPDRLSELSAELGTPIVRVEDGFLRSVGLGSDFERPISLVFDQRGIYFNPSKPSALEEILQKGKFSDALLQEARELRRFIVNHDLTKYNLPRHRLPDVVLHRAASKKVVLVPGQVEDDASILLGAGSISTNLGLLKAVRKEEPDAFIIYKPHPDVLSGKRKGALHLEKALLYCDHVETRADIITCIKVADTLHTMTSLSGFDALLRGKRVVCHGMPFYAGWGLTEDRVPIPRRQHRRTLEELVAATLLMYPRYVADKYITDAKKAATIMHHLLQQRDNAHVLGKTRLRLRKYMNMMKGILTVMKN